MLARLNQILAQYFIPFFPFLDRCVHYPLRIIIDYIFLQRGIAEANQCKWENSEKDEVFHEALADLKITHHSPSLIQLLSN